MKIEDKAQGMAMLTSLRVRQCTFCRSVVCPVWVCRSASLLRFYRLPRSWRLSACCQHRLSLFLLWYLAPDPAHFVRPCFLLPPKSTCLLQKHMFLFNDDNLCVTEWLQPALVKLPLCRWESIVARRETKINYTQPWLWYFFCKYFP